MANITRFGSDSGSDIEEMDNPSYHEDADLDGSDHMNTEADFNEDVAILSKHGVEVNWVKGQGQGEYSMVISTRRRSKIDSDTNLAGLYESHEDDKKDEDSDVDNSGMATDTNNSSKGLDFAYCNPMAQSISIPSVPIPALKHIPRSPTAQEISVSVEIKSGTTTSKFVEVLDTEIPHTGQSVTHFIRKKFALRGGYLMQQQKGFAGRFKGISDSNLDLVHVLPEEDLRYDIVYKFVDAVPERPSIHLIKVPSEEMKIIASPSTIKFGADNSSRPLTSTPRCQSTQEQLLEENILLKGTEMCPVCLLFSVHCPVACHPHRSANEELIGAIQSLILAQRESAATSISLYQHMMSFPWSMHGTASSDQLPVPSTKCPEKYGGIPISALHSLNRPSPTTGIQISSQFPIGRQREAAFYQLLDYMRMSTPVFSGVAEQDAYVVDEFFIEHQLEFTSDWQHPATSIKSVQEKLCKALNDIGIRAYNLHDGNHLLDDQLYVSHLWSLRQYSPDGQMFPIRYCGWISGKPDLVSLGRPLIEGQTIVRHMVDFAIHVFLPEVFHKSLKHCLIEGCLQLIGLCGDNSNNSPPVILTDTNSNIYVVTLVLESDLPLLYSFAFRKCANLTSAIHFASVEGKQCKSFNFCRPATPTL